MRIAMSRLILIRGVPGSGKSTLAEWLCRGYRDQGNDCFITEADQYFINPVKNNEYEFDASKLGEAHASCLKRTRIGLGYNSVVIVANTFTTKKELKPYFDLAKLFDIEVQVILCQGNFTSIHNVPEETIKKMKARFEYDIGDLL